MAFADHAGRYYARRYSYPPMMGRVLGYLAICEPREQTINELSEALLASRSAITGAVKVLEDLHAIRRSRAAGDRMDRIRIDVGSSLEEKGFDASQYKELGNLAREGLALLKDAPAERRAVLLETAALADFLLERIPAMHKEWQRHRDALRAAGELPDAH